MKPRLNLNFVQIMAVFATIQFNWPAPVRNTFDVLSVFNFNLNLLATECSVAWGYEVKWGLTMALPLLCVVVWGVGVGVTEVGRRLGLPGMVVIPNEALISASMLLLSFGYLTLTAKVLEPLACSAAEGSKYRLDAAPHLLCYEGWWWNMLGPVVVFVFVYVLGIPAFFAWIIHRHLDEFEDVDSVAVARYGVIASRYKPRMGWYELAVMGRKGMVVIAQLFFTNRASVQATIIELALLGAMAVHFRFRAYAEPELNHVESALLLCGLVVLMMGHLLHADPTPFVTYLTVALIVGAVLVVVAVIGIALMAEVESRKEHAKLMTGWVPPEWVALMKAAGEEEEEGSSDGIGGVVVGGIALHDMDHGVAGGQGRG